MKKIRKEVIDVPGVSRHLKKEGIPLNPVIRAGDFVFVSGLTPMDRRTGRIPLVTIDQQARTRGRRSSTSRSTPSRWWTATRL